MKLQLTKNLFAFIIATTMFSAIPAMLNAQRYPPKKCHSCPARCCVNGYCMWGCGYLKDSSPSNAISFQLEEAQNVSAKIYDATGRLVKTIANGKMSEGYHQIEWDSKDETGNAAQAGVYYLRMDGDNYIGTKKILMVK